MNPPGPILPMTAESLVFWIFAFAWAIVVGLLMFVQLPRIVGNASRIIKRVIALVADSSLPAQVAKAGDDLERLSRALERVAPLRKRALDAVQTIRATPLVPSAIGEIVGRIKAEIRAFRRTFR
jgi:hypothetical protein